MGGHGGLSITNIDPCITNFLMSSTSYLGQILWGRRGPFYSRFFKINRDPPIDIFLNLIRDFFRAEFSLLKFSLFSEELSRERWTLLCQILCTIRGPSQSNFSKLNEEPSTANFPGLRWTFSWQNFLYLNRDFSVANCLHQLFLHPQKAFHSNVDTLITNSLPPTGISLEQIFP